ncbi:uncharacterized protein LOC133289777 [Gastrolobium bilobum]|uniref:uncharacterized protein LOC133289777 n=1 Tax=Gastrolobium bilobum TaxID=150636 RepID=UPI002AAFC3A2|nr:uncharacterized protein LOC133289777 [Gastrolobium bilobum]
MNGLVWNCRGAAKKPFKSTLRNFTKKYKVGLAAILEPIISGAISLRRINQLGFKSYLIEDAIGYMGGIWLLWNKDQFSIELIEKSNQLIHVNYFDSNGMNFVLTVVYASPREEVRQDLWKDLRRISSNLSKPWMVMGDFNEIMYAREKKGGIPVNLSRCLNFVGVLDGYNLMDIGCAGSKFTWRGAKCLHLERVFKRLDRVCANASWRTIFGEAKARTLPRLNSDHNPILLSLYPTESNWRERPFRFLAAWQDHVNFIPFLKSTWNINSNIFAALTNLVAPLKDWNINVFGHIQTKKEDLINKLQKA